MPKATPPGDVARALLRDLGIDHGRCARDAGFKATLRQAITAAPLLEAYAWGSEVTLAQAVAEHHAGIFRRLSSTRRPPFGAISSFAGGGDACTILSTCSRALLTFFSTSTVLPLRATCKEACEAVASYPWHDCRTVIRGSTRDWRACFPRALAARASANDHSGVYRAGHQSLRKTQLQDVDLAPLAGVQDLQLHDCLHITTAAFPHLSAVRTLDLGCHSVPAAQPCFADAALACLTSLEDLSVAGCTQLTDAALATLATLPQLRTLNISRCTQLTAAALAPLQHLTHLTIDRCTQLHDSALAPLHRLQALSMRWCSGIGGEALQHLPNLHTLDMGFCEQESLGDGVLQHVVPKLRELRLMGCCQRTLTDSIFEHAARLRVLDMTGCRQFTDAAFQHLQGRLHTLCMRECHGPLLTEKALDCLGGVLHLDLSDTAFTQRHVKARPGIFQPMLSIAVDDDDDVEVV